MIRYVIALLTLIVLCGSVHADRPADVAGYADTRWGMALSEVQSLYPSLRVGHPYSYRLKQYFTNATVRAIRIYNVQFDLIFSFRPDGKLDGADLKSIDNNDIDTSIYNELTSEMVTKYGAYELTQNDFNEQHIYTETKTWKFPSTTIRASQWMSPDKKCNIIMAYSSESHERERAKEHL